MKDHWEVNVRWRQDDEQDREAAGGSGKARALAGTACSVTRYEAPKSKSSCRDEGGHIGQSFRMEADFGGTCGNCEFRQFIRGSFKVNGLELTHMLPGATNPPTYEPGQPMSRTSFLEDGLSPYPGYGPHYGHRDEIGAGDDIYRNPNRATGCEYRGSDFPGLSGLDSGDAYAIDLEFRGEVINTVENTTLRTSTWKVQCAGTVA